MKGELFNKCSYLSLGWLINNRLSRNVTLCVLVLLSCLACTSRSIYLNKNFNPPVYFGQHVVQRGDTLYSIAWRYGRELKGLAQVNKIKSPYVIVPGQRIDLERGDWKSNGGLSVSKAAGQSGGNVTKSKRNVSRGKYVTKNKKHKKFNSIKWQWPYVGPILARYNVNSKGRSVQKKLNKGLDISGRVGAPIFAAATGEVVYAGGGLLGYGNLVIINHNEMYLSAYAHNRRILVKEGQKIRIGEKIAEMGGSDKKQAMLHFEIRRNGQPVDPMNYLPQKSKK